MKLTILLTAVVPVMMPHGAAMSDFLFDFSGTNPLRPATAASRDCGADTSPPGLARYVIEHNGRARSYSVYRPRPENPHRPQPVVIDLHGSGSNPSQELSISGMATVADERGMLVVLPSAIRPFPAGGHTWNIPRDDRFPDDIVFVRDILAEVVRSNCVDASRVYVAGFSGGGRLASAIACRLADRVAALGVVGGLRAPTGCSRPVPVIAVHGTGDPINPYDGAGPAYWRYGIDQAFTAWLRQNRCDRTPRTTRLATDVERISATGCQANAEVRLLRVEGAGHVWPGSSFAFPPERFGPSSRSLDATRRMVEFFMRFHLPDG